MRTFGRPRITLRRIVALAAAAVFVAALAAYLVVSESVYDQVSHLDVGWCDRTMAANTPASFSTTVQGAPYVDTTPYRMPGYQTVSIPSRDAGFTLSAWWVPAPATSDGRPAPAVVVVHGRGKCKRDPEVLLPAGMLHRAGFSVLLIDMRNHGGSTTPDGRWDFAVRSYRDVLGAWDWLQSNEHLPASRIGLYGVSYGAASVIDAIGSEPRVAAAWEDSSWSDTDVWVRDVLRSRGYPDWLAPGGILVARVLHGIDITSPSPASSIAQLDGRPFFIVHGDADESVLVKHAYALADVIAAHGGHVEPWIVPGAAHVRSSFIATAEYDRRLTAFFTAALGATAVPA